MVFFITNIFVLVQITIINRNPNKSLLIKHQFWPTLDFIYYMLMTLRRVSLTGRPTHRIDIKCCIHNNKIYSMYMHDYIYMYIFIQVAMTGRLWMCGECCKCLAVRIHLYTTQYFWSVNKHDFGVYWLVVLGRESESVALREYCTFVWILCVCVCYLIILFRVTKIYSFISRILIAFEKNCLNNP